MTNEVTSASERHEDPGAVGSPVQCPVGRLEPERAEWEHLLPYGYAPGHYMGTCRTCGTVCIDLDKRAASCRPCAEAKYAAREFTPAELVVMNEAGRATSILGHPPTDNTNPV